MPLDRREFLQRTSAGVVTGALGSHLQTRAPGKGPVKAVAFDAFPIFDPRPVLALAETLFPGKGGELGNAWRARQFEYQWLRALSGQYADFWRTTEDGLVFAARQLRLELPPEKRDRLMHSYLELKAWPDVASALSALRQKGIRLAFLSNMTKMMLEAGIRNSNLDGQFELVLSTDSIRTYKPDPRAYQLGIDALRLGRDEILFAAFAGWDATGAKWFGYPTFWVNRADSPPEELGIAPDATGRNLADLVNFVNAAP
jgi:2-haloacid dehalogenase